MTRILKTNRSFVKCALALLVVSVTFARAESTDFPKIFNTEKSKEPLLAPEEAAKRFSTPPGFKVSLFAGEPDVQQPIAMTTDSRGRLWVVENYTYSEGDIVFNSHLRDRIIILEDSRHTGHFDKRTVFWDKGQKVTSVAVGFGGVWVLAAPQLLFIPDRNGDDVPDSDPIVVLDGWDDHAVRHNVVNGLMWGPDGWLYGRHGILANSFVGKPGTSKEQRAKINCGVWRYHPTKQIFEVVANGTTNPWGMDWNEQGEPFFINTVIGHLWHLIPGAHYKRMYGEDFDRHTYQLIDQHADHYHWDTGKSWQLSRTGDVNDALGGGHAHSGLMFYLGTNWPERYRNTLFTINLHGHRLNNDLIVRSGCGYVGKHGEDLLKDSDPWFRAVDLNYGPDGGVFIADWSDVGECHETDGVHRSSGRIYKVTYGGPAVPSVADVSKLSNSELVQLQTNKNEWLVRQARRVLQERAAEGQGMDVVHRELLGLFQKQTDISAKLRAMWALYVTGGASENWLLQQVSARNENVRSWAVRLLADGQQVSTEVAKKLASIGKQEKSGLVRLYLASALQKIPVEARWDLAAALLSHAEDENDHNQPLMIWYGIEPLSMANSQKAIALARGSKLSVPRAFIARRLTEEIETNAEVVNALVAMAAKAPEQIQADVISGMAEALHGWHNVRQPQAWTALERSVAAGKNKTLRNDVRELGLIFGDANAFASLREIFLDETASKENRREALQKFLGYSPRNQESLLQTLLTNKALAVVAARGLTAYEDTKLPNVVVSHYRDFPTEDRNELMTALVSRADYAQALLDAVAAGRIDKRDISPFHARQISSLNNGKLNEQLKEVWGEVRTTSDEKKQLIAKYKLLLTPEQMKKADPSKGRELFSKTCALCHTLYGEGAKIGPDLTGSQRRDVSYLLENVVDPSAIVGADYRVSVVTLKDGRVLNGIIKNKTDRTLTVQSFTEAVTLERGDIADIKGSSTSLMPDGLLEAFPDEQVMDLVSYLTSSHQVPLPSAAK